MHCSVCLTYFLERIHHIKLLELLEKKPELCINHGPPLYPNPSDIFFYDMNLEKQNNMYRQKRDPYDALRRDGYNWKYIGRYPFGSHRKQLSEAVDEFKNKTKFCRAYYESSKEDARFVVIHYFGDNSNATRTGYLHGNSKNKNKRYIPTAISTLRAIEQIAETESPAKAYDIFKKGMNDAKAPHFLPRDPLQIRNASRKRKKINSSSNVNNNIPYYSNLVDDTVRSSSNVSNSIPYYSYLADDTVRQSLASAVDKDTTIYQLEKDDFNNFCLKDKTGIYALQKKDDNWICSCRMGDDKCIHIIILK